MRGSGRKPPRLKDWHLWTEVTRTVSPLHPERLKKEASEALTPPGPAGPVETPVKPRVNGHTAPPPLTLPRVAMHAPEKPIEPKLNRKLRRGHIPIDATVDLHGLRQDEAHAALRRFITARHARGDRTVLVVTGKGLKKTGWGQIEQKGVLRYMLPLWLSEKTLSPLVAGWQEAAREHGGEGAVYVRLKRQTR